MTQGFKVEKTFCYSERSHQILNELSDMELSLHITALGSFFHALSFLLFWFMVNPNFIIWIWTFLLWIFLKFSLTVIKYSFGTCKSLRALIIFLAIHFHFWTFIMHSNINGFSSHVMNSGFQWCGILWNFCNSHKSVSLGTSYYFDFYCNFRSSLSLSRFK